MREPAGLKQNRFIYFTGVFLLLMFLAFKIIKYNLFYYQEDVFSCYQLTQSWFKGRGILWEAILGNYVSQHNFYFALLLFPFTYLLGVKGLFFAQAFLLLGSWHTWANAIKSKTGLLIGLLIIAGPYSLYLVEDSVYGWHFELLFFPLGILFANALSGSKLFLKVILGTAICLVKEDGAVVACCIHLFYLIHKTSTNGENVFDNDNRKIIFKAIGLWLLVFLAGIFLLKMQNTQTNWRGDKAIEVFANDKISSQIIYLTTLLGRYLLFILPLLLMIFIFFGRKYFFLTIICLIPVIIIELLSGMYYYPSLIFSLTYPPRLAQSMAVIGSAILLLFTDKKIVLKKINISIVYFILLCVFILQVVLLKTIRGFDLPMEISNVIISRNNGITPRQQKVIRCLAKVIPADKAVVVPDFMYNVFDKHDCYWKDRPHNFIKQPDVFIFKDSADARYFPRLEEYALKKISTFYVFLKKNSGIDISACR